jgi:hypothetical protein
VEPFPTTEENFGFFTYFYSLMFRGEYVIYREEEVSSPGLKIKKSSKKILKS